MRALATLLHEASHRTLAKNKMLNDTIGSFFSGYLILQLLSSYRESHVRNHHGNFGNPETDLDFKFALDEGLYEEILDRKSFFRRNVIFPLFLSKLLGYLKFLTIHRFLGNIGSFKEKIIATLYLIVLIILGIILGCTKAIILFWLVPYLTVFQILGWFVEVAEHYPLMLNKTNLYMSRNRHSHWLEAFLTGMHGESYHLVHHLNPSIPFWNIEKAHAIYLQDENYNYFNSTQCGGIFISSNNAPSLLEILAN